MEWLGFLINLTKGEFAVPERKIQAFKSKLLEVKSVRHVQARHLPSVIGKINSMSLGLVPPDDTESVCHFEFQTVLIPEVIINC